jgi:hypothetical protein
MRRSVKRSGQEDKTGLRAASSYTSSYSSSHLHVAHGRWVEAVVHCGYIQRLDAKCVACTQRAGKCRAWSEGRTGLQGHVGCTVP